MSERSEDQERLREVLEDGDTWAKLSRQDLLIRPATFFGFGLFITTEGALFWGSHTLEARGVFFAILVGAIVYLFTVLLWLFKWGCLSGALRRSGVLGSLGIALVAAVLLYWYRDPVQSWSVSLPIGRLIWLVLTVGLLILVAAKADDKPLAPPVKTLTAEAWYQRLEVLLRRQYHWPAAPAQRAVQQLQQREAAEGIVPEGDYLSLVSFARELTKRDLAAPTSHYSWIYGCFYAVLAGLGGFVTWSEFQDRSWLYLCLWVALTLLFAWRAFTYLGWRRGRKS